MSLTHNIHKVSGDVKRAVTQISRGGILGLDGSVRGTQKTFGYVCDIHTEGELAGTIDVQEFGYEAGDYDTPGVGLHEGVQLSAIQNNKGGMLIVPMLFSEVVICQNPMDGLEYVLMYSHAQTIRMVATADKGNTDSYVEVGVTEVENFVETDDGLEKDYDELEATKNKASTRYLPGSITHQVTSANDEMGTKEVTTAADKTIMVGDTTVTIDGQNVNIKTSGKVSFTIGGTTITQQNGTVNIKADDATIESSNATIKGSNVTITGGTLKTQGASSADGNGPFNPIKVCPFSGAPHCGSTVSGT